MGNLWTEFSKLLPITKTYIGTINSIDESKGLSYITLVSGEIITARGTSVQVGSNCIIENNTVISKAPSLGSIVEITINVF